MFDNVNVLQVCIYAAGVVLLGLAFEFSCHLVYLHAVAVSGAFTEMKALKGFAMEGAALLSMAAFTLVFLLLKVNFICFGQTLRDSIRV